MIFTVVLPNSVVIEIDVDIRANGQECLDQVRSNVTYKNVFHSLWRKLRKFPFLLQYLYNELSVV